MDVPLLGPARHDHGHGQPWLHPDDRTRSPSPVPIPRSKKRSPNRVKARPANPAVISSIITSLETLAPPSDDRPQHWLETPNGIARPYSPSGAAVASPPIVPRSSGTSATLNFRRQSDDRLYSQLVDVATLRSAYDVDRDEAGQRQLHEGDNKEEADNDDDDDDDDEGAAFPPSIPTSRAPSGLNHYIATRPSSYRGLGTPAGAPAQSMIPQASSGPTHRANRRLSAESWVRTPAGSPDVPTLSAVRASRGLRRVGSQETLRPEGQSLDSPATGGSQTDMFELSKAEQIIARATPPLGPHTPAPKPRVYLGDGTVEAKHVQLARESPNSVITYPEVVDSPRGSPRSSIRSWGKRPAKDDTRSVSSASIRSTPARISLMVESIPERTSSLRVSSRSPSGRKKGEKKGKKTNGCVNGAVPSLWSVRSSSIPESSWADLGDDHDTVRRIRQLRAEKETRMRTSGAYSVDMGRPATQDMPDLPRLATADSSASASRDVEQDTDPRPLPNRALTEPAGDTQQWARDSPSALTHLPRGSSLAYRNGASGTTVPPVPSAHGVQEDRALSPNKRPSTAASKDSTRISLEYSYVEAVNALQKLGGASSNGLNRTGLVSPPSIPESPDPTCSQSSPGGKKKMTIRGYRDSWIIHQDLPFDADHKKTRRKSTSDVRHGKPIGEEALPRRRDSIEDEVRTFLSADRLSQHVLHPVTGRVISFSEVGDPTGAAVMVCLGMGLTRYVSAFYDELATTLRLRLITIERPGVAASAPYHASDRSGPLNWPDDVLAVCHKLGVTRFSMIAHSAGAVYALATALILPQLIVGKVHLLAPWIPPSQLEVISHHSTSAAPAQTLPRSQRLLRVLPTPFLKAANSSFVNATSASLKPAKRKTGRGRGMAETHDWRLHDRPGTARPATSQRRESMMVMDHYMPDTNPMEHFLISGDDRVAAPGAKEVPYLSATAGPTDPGLAYASDALNAAEHEERERKVDFTSCLTQRTWELATRESNPATDLLVCLERQRQVGFRYTDVQSPVVITHGTEDKRVPIANIKWLAEQMNRRAAGGYGSRTLDSRDSQRTEAAGAGQRCELRVLQGEGHGLMASPVIMSDLLTEIASYWIGEDRNASSKSR